MDHVIPDRRNIILQCAINRCFTTSKCIELSTHSNTHRHTHTHAWSSRRQPFSVLSVRKAAFVFSNRSRTKPDLYSGWTRTGRQVAESVCLDAEACARMASHPRSLPVSHLPVSPGRPPASWAACWVLAVRHHCQPKVLMAYSCGTGGALSTFSIPPPLDPSLSGLPPASRSLS